MVGLLQKQSLESLMRWRLAFSRGVSAWELGIQRPVRAQMTSTTKTLVQLDAAFFCVCRSHAAETSLPWSGLDTGSYLQGRPVVAQLALTSTHVMHQ